MGDTMASGVGETGPRSPSDVRQVRHVIGLTGSFGSGCTTAAAYLRDDRGFHPIKLSDAIKSELAKEGNASPSRHELQRKGDELREATGGRALVELSLAALDGTMPERIVFDGIRNVAEINFLQNIFGDRLTLIAVIAPSKSRWDRIGTTNYTNHGLTQTDFIDDDRRDRNEEVPHGQQVELCVDRADVLIDNGPSTDHGAFREKINEYADLAIGAITRQPKQSEILMNVAYGASHSSKCLKRHVGAVVVDTSGQVVGLGYNENPLSTKPCVEEPEYKFTCYRDIVRNKHFASLVGLGAKCPVCGKAIETSEGPPWRCSACQREGKKTNLEEFFFPDRALNWCTAIHAEVWALRLAGERARGGVLYTTTFPCFQCAEQIAQSGISTVFFTEAYPDVHGAQRLRLADIQVRQFEGVRSSRFERIFARSNPTIAASLEPLMVTR